MLYGNIIFIKKTGGDGSKYPVSEKSIKIGRSEECLIRIYNTQVALEHCQLIIGENGQATLKDLSNQTFLNGNILAHEESTLCHGDIFKVGERLARWEYLPTSKYYRQLLSPTGRLVAVVMPQQRCLEDQSGGTSASSFSVLKSTPVVGKRRYSERFASESAPGVKIRKSSSFNLIKKTKGDLSKLLTGRHSLKTKKLLPVIKIKDRKSTSGIINSKTPKDKCRKSTLPSWKINILSPPTTKLTEEKISLSRKSYGKSAQSSNSRNKNLLKDTLEPESKKLSVAKKRIRSPQKTTVTSEEIVKSTSKNVLKTPLKVAVDSPLKIRASAKSTRSLSKSPSPKKPSLISTPSPKPVRFIHSEKKLKSVVGKSSARTRELNRLSLVLTRVDKNIRNTELRESYSREELKNLRRARGRSFHVSDKNVQTMLKYNKSHEGLPDEREQSPIKMKSFEKFDKALKSSENKVKTPRINETEKGSEELAKEKLKTPAPIDTVQTSFLSASDDVKDSDEKERQGLHFQNKSIAAKSTPLKKTPKKLEKNVGKLKPSSSRKNLSKSPSRSATSAANSASARSSKSSSVRISLRKTINLSKERISSPRGVRRKLSPSISSAERAAKKLKTSSPKKPDKNKKAALLVLGKANRKQLLPQNVKVLLKQKIVKKAIKQSTIASTEKVDHGKKDSFAVKNKPIKGLQKNTLKAKKKAKKKENDSSKGNAPESSSESVEMPPQSKDEMGNISENEKALEGNVRSNSKVVEISLRSPSKIKILFNEAPGKSLSKQYRKSESPRSILSQEASSPPYRNFEKVAENFLFNSNRRCSKRLSSKNDLGRPDFVELSPTALGLIPKNIEFFKSPKQNKRRSSSLVTPKNIQSFGIIKSASTSKIGSRKNVRFLSKGMSFNSEFCTPSEKTDFDFGAFQTPDVSVDAFISPLGDKTSGSKKGCNESSRTVFASEDNSELALAYRSSTEPRKCARKLLQSPQPKRRVSSNQDELLRGSRSSSIKVRKQPTDPGINNSGTSLSDFDLDIYKTPKNDLADINGVLRLLRNPKNDSTIQFKDIKGVKKLQKSPKNDLSDVKGVKKLLATPKVQKSPKNDLSDVRGVKKLLTTPKVQKSPKNDLSDVRGVKKLLATPKVQKSPKNDLSDVKGVKKLLATPKVQKSPKNDLSDVRGVKKLLATPKVRKSPGNNLTDVAGVKELFRSPRMQKSSKNELLELSGVHQLFVSPKLNRSSRSNSAGTKKESLCEFLVENLIGSPKNQNLSKYSKQGLKGFSESGRLDTDTVGDTMNDDGVKQVLEMERSRGIVPINQKSVSRKSIYLTSKEPKNDLSDVTGVRELFTRHKPNSGFNESLTGVPELFNLPEEETVSTPRGKTSRKRSTIDAVQKVPRMARSKRGAEDKDDFIKTRRDARGILRKASAEETVRRSARGKKLKTEDGLSTELVESKPTKRKAAQRTKPNKVLNSPAVMKKSERIKKETKRSRRTSQVRTKAEPKQSGEIKTRKRKATVEDTVSPPPKLRRKGTAENVTKTTSRSKTALSSREKISVKTVRKASAKVKNETSKCSSRVQNKTSKTSAERILKVQEKRSRSSSKKNLSDSKEKLSPIKTRSAKRQTASRQTHAGKQSSRSGNKITGRKKLSPMVKKMTRRK